MTVFFASNMEGMDVGWAAGPRPAGLTPGACLTGPEAGRCVLKLPGHTACGGASQVQGRGCTPLPSPHPLFLPPRALGLWTSTLPVLGPHPCRPLGSAIWAQAGAGPCGCQGVPAIPQGPGRPLGQREGGGWRGFLASGTVPREAQVHCLQLPSRASASYSKPFGG